MSMTIYSLFSSISSKYRRCRFPPRSHRISRIAFAVRPFRPTIFPWSDFAT